jgi:trimethylamine--corrinoid protein Co-methyltransferase
VYAAGHSYDLMTPAQVGLIHASALRLLEEAGLGVQHAGLLQALADFGLPVDFEAERVRFPRPRVEQYLAEADQHNWADSRPTLSASAGVYHSLYHEPTSGQLVPWHERALAGYAALARQLPHVGQASVLGCPFEAASLLEPLYERYYCWKHGALEGGSIWLDELCPYLLDLYQARAEALGQPLSQVFRGTAYLASSLQLGRHEAYQVAYFRERDLRVNIGGSMMSLGATAPVTLAGGVTLNLAEQLALGILNWALFGVKQLEVHASVSILDMRTTIRPYGCPEMAMANLMTAQWARCHGALFNGHAGLTDAKLPSAEAGAQKALTAIPTLLAGGSLWVDAGLLSLDEVCSPVQLILDNEFIGALSQFTREFEVSEQSIGLETMLATGPGGQYLDKQHTLDYFRTEHWQPSLWSRQMLQPWTTSGAKLDVDLARDLARELLREAGAPEPLPEWLDGEFRRILQSARQVLGS